MINTVVMTELFVFTVVVDNIERIAMHPVDNYPLMYVLKKGIEKDKTREYLQSMADLHGLTFQLKHFKCVETLETIEAMKTRVTQ